MKLNLRIIGIINILFLFYLIVIISSQQFVFAEQIDWEDDFRLSYALGDSYEPEIIIDYYDNIHIVWTDLRDGVAEVYYKKYDDSGWSDDLKLDNDENGHSIHPSIAYDSQNNLYVVFADNRRPDNLDEIYYTMYDGNVWSISDRITINANMEGIIDYGPEIVIDSQNNLYVFWSADRSPINDYEALYYVMYDGQDWSSIIQITNNTRDHLVGSVVVDSNDNIHLVYTDRWPTGTSGYYFSIYYQKYDGNDWSSPLKIDNSDIAGAADIMVDVQNNIHITWADARSGNYEIYYSKLASDGSILIDNKRETWNPEAPGPHGVIRKSSALDSQDNIHTTWLNQEDDNWDYFTIMYLKLDNNGDILINKTNVTTSGLGNEYSPNIAIDSKDRIHMVFMDDRDGNQEIYYKATQYYDLSISSNDIEFSKPNPKNGEEIIINTTINNNGGYLTNATIHFYQDSIEPANLIESDFVQIPAGGTELTSIQWSAITGIHTIWVEIEAEDGIVETNLTNNIASKTITVNDPPTITVTAPPSGITTIDDSYMISWVGNDPDDDAQIELYYDDDNTDFDGTLIDTSDQFPLGITDNNGVTQTYKWDTSTLSDGSSYYIYTKIDDPLHNPVYSYSQGKVKIDHQNIAPTIEITSSPGGTISGIVTIEGIASDSDGSVQLVEIKFDHEDWITTTGTTSWSYEWDTTTATNGEHTISAKARDDSGLYSQEDFITVTVNNGGNMVPSVDITSHYNGEVVSGTTQLSGTAVDHDGSVELVQVSIDTGSWETTTGTSSWSFNWDTTTMTNGEQALYVRAKDNSNEYSQIESITLIVDNGGNIPPIIYILSPTGGTVSGEVTIEGSASDLDGDNTIEYVQIKIDEGDWEDVDEISEWSYTWDTTTLDDGNYTISARAYDGIDYSKVKSVIVSIDNPHKPTLTITSEIPEEVSGTIRIQGTTSDIDGEIIKVEVQIDNGEWEEIEGTSEWSYELDTKKLENGEHTIRIRVHDDEGEYYEEVFSITVKNEEDIFWVYLIIAIIVICTILGVAVWKMRGKSGIEPKSVQQIDQTQGQTVKCPQCNSVFEVPQGSETIKCPYCGLSGKSTT